VPAALSRVLIGAGSRCARPRRNAGRARHEGRSGEGAEDDVDVVFLYCNGTFTLALYVEGTWYCAHCGKEVRHVVA